MKDAMQRAASSSLWRHMPSASLGHFASLSFVVNWWRAAILPSLLPKKKVGRSMKILGLLLLVGIGILVWKVLQARAEFPPYDILIEEDEQMMVDDWDGLA